MGKKKKSNKVTKSQLNDLIYAVNKFNSTIEKIEKNKIDNYILPNKVDYKDLVKNIITEKQFNKILKELRSFNIAEAKNLITLNSGITITQWEHKINIKNIDIGLNNIEKQIKKEEIKEKTNPSLMGNQKIKGLESTGESLKSYYSDDIKNYKRLQHRIKIHGNYDYDLKKKRIYRENFLTAVKGLQNYPEKKIIYEYLKSITDLDKFYDITKDTQVLKEIFLYYKEPETTLFEFNTQEEMIEYALKELNLSKEEILEITKKEEQARKKKEQARKKKEQARKKNR